MTVKLREFQRLVNCSSSLNSSSFRLESRSWDILFTMFESSSAELICCTTSVIKACKNYKLLKVIKLIRMLLVSIKSSHFGLSCKSWAPSQIECISERSTITVHDKLTAVQTTLEKWQRKPTKNSIFVFLSTSCLFCEAITWMMQLLFSLLFKVLESYLGMKGELWSFTWQSSVSLISWVSWMDFPRPFFLVQEGRTSLTESINEVGRCFLWFWISFSLANVLNETKKDKLSIYLSYSLYVKFALPW